MKETADLTPLSAAAQIDYHAAQIAAYLAAIPATERDAQYARLCEQLGLAPINRPNEFMVLGGSFEKYLDRRQARQVRAVHRITLVAVEDAPAPTKCEMARADRALKSGEITQDQWNALHARFCGSATGPATVMVSETVRESSRSIDPRVQAIRNSRRIAKRLAPKERHLR